MGDAMWWKDGIIYQIYPRSFQDTDDNGVGDLPGIIKRLPYLAELGVDAIWLSPIFTSPMRDFGYDIADYTAIDPLFGTLGDFDRLVEAAHARGIKVILDLVPNHTSDLHPWFRESRASRQNARRDWYIWRDPAPGGGPPTNWLSQFGGSGWQFDAATGQYYYHAFLAAQPDLNWRNGNVRAAIYDAMRFWLRRGADGFRVDVIWHLIKDSEFRDNPPNPDFNTADPPHLQFLPLYTTDRPELEEIVTEMRAVVDEFPDRVLIGEIYLPLERLVTYYGRDLRGLHLPFNFALLASEWSAAAIADLIDRYEALLPQGAWPNWVLGNHDTSRIAGRIGDRQARLAAVLLLTLRGTPTIYYGDELGMPQVSIPTEEALDPFEHNVPGRGCGRDGSRTPMQWDRSAYSGFSAVKPWLPVAEDYGCRNVEVERGRSNSMLTLYQRLIRLRREHAALQRGSYRRVARRDNLLVYRRELEDRTLLVALNFGTEEALLPEVNGRVLFSVNSAIEGSRIASPLRIGGGEGVLIDLAANGLAH